jgi:hypothetical protein
MFSLHRKLFRECCTRNREKTVGVFQILRKGIPESEGKPLQETPAHMYTALTDPTKPSENKWRERKSSETAVGSVDHSLNENYKFPPSQWPPMTSLYKQFFFVLKPQGFRGYPWTPWVCPLGWVSTPAPTPRAMPYPLLKQLIKHTHTHTLQRATKPTSMHTYCTWHWHATSFPLSPPFPSLYSFYILSLTHPCRLVKNWGISQDNPFNRD